MSDPITEHDKHLDQFTRRARRVLWLALDVASTAGHRAIEPEHVLVGLAQAEGSIAQASLQELHIDAAMLRTLLLRRMPPQAIPAGSTEGETPFSPETRDLLSMALNTSRTMGNAFVGTEHILLAIMEQSRYGVVAMLNECGSSADTVMRRVRKILKTTPGPSNSATPDAAGFHHLIKVAIREAEDSKQAAVTPEHLLLAMSIAAYPPVTSLLEPYKLDEDRLRGIIKQVYGTVDEAGEAPPRSSETQQVIHEAEYNASANNRQVMPYDLFFALMTDATALRRLFSVLSIDRAKLQQELVRYGIQPQDFQAGKRQGGGLFRRG
jgi:ATP-dependent Clp protease ATP-binding subunit ClpA